LNGESEMRLQRPVNYRGLRKHRILK
jgi:hypothetical protein